MVQEKQDGGTPSRGRATEPSGKHAKSAGRESEIYVDEYYKLLQSGYLNERILPKSKMLAEVMKYVPSQARIHKLKMSEHREEVALSNAVHPLLDYQVYNLRNCVVCQQRTEAPKKKFAYPPREVNYKTPQEARAKLAVALKELYEQVAFVKAFFDQFTQDFLGEIPKNWESSLPHYKNFLKVVYRLSASLYTLTRTMRRVTTDDQMLGWCTNSQIQMNRVDKQGRLVLDIEFDKNDIDDEYTDESEDEESPAVDPSAPSEQGAVLTGEAAAGSSTTAAGSTAATAAGLSTAATAAGSSSTAATAAGSSSTAATAAGSSSTAGTAAGSSSTAGTAAGSSSTAGTAAGSSTTAATAAKSSKTAATAAESSSTAATAAESSSTTAGTAAESSSTTAGTAAESSSTTAGTAAESSTTAVTAAAESSSASVKRNKMEKAKKVSYRTEVTESDGKNTSLKKKFFVGYEYKYR